MSNFVDLITSNKFCLIAEAGVNYYEIANRMGISIMDAAKLMCLEAQQAGVHVIKFQTYKAENLAVKKSPSYWDTSKESTASQYELFSKYDFFGEAEYREVAEYCSSIGIEFCSTAFDFESADYLDDMMNVYKISSSDLTNLPFIEYQAKKGKPVIMSVGAGDLDEIRAAVSTIRAVNSEPLVLLHCVLQYPTPYGCANLSRIRTLGEKFPHEIIGYSDHCRPDSHANVIKAAYTLGARVVEKHFTLDKTLQGNDHYHAMDPDDARSILEGISFVDMLLGNPEIIHSETEDLARLNARRSIVASVGIPSGTVIQKEMLTFKRPGTGISPSEVNSILGRRAVCDIPEDEVLKYGMIS